MSLTGRNMHIAFIKYTYEYIYLKLDLLFQAYGDHHESLLHYCALERLTVLILWNATSV
jgi:hypothetical protein